MSAIESIGMGAFDLLLAGSIVMLFAKGSAMAQDIGKAEMQTQHNTTLIQEYREWNRWDMKITYNSDLISAALQYRGVPKIQVNKKGATSTTWGARDTALPISELTPANTKDSNVVDIYSAFEDATVKYVSMIEKDVNGEVSCIHFVEQS